MNNLFTFFLLNFLPFRSSVKEYISTPKPEMLEKDEKKDNRTSEWCKKYEAPVHVDSENTMERQCAQQ